MRILMVGLDLNPPWVEGIRNNVRSLSKNLKSNNHQVFYLTKGSKNQSKVEFIEEIKYHRILIGDSDNYLSGGVSFFFKLLWNLHKVTNEEKIDVIHGHSVYPVFGIILGLYSKFNSVNSVFTLYSSVDNKKNKDLKYPKIMHLLNFSKNKPFTKLLSYLTDKIIVTSKSAQKSLKMMKISDEKVIHIPIGVDLTLFCPLNDINHVRNSLGIHESQKIILFAGDITPWKGLDIFLKSINEVKKNFKDIIFVIMTKNIYKYENERKKEVMDFIRLNNLESNTIFIGQMKKINEIYGIANIIVFPFITLFSVMDIPLSALEAMAMSKPIIATRVGSFEELIENEKDGILISPNNETELSEAIVYLLNNPDLCKLISINARDNVKNDYDILQVTKKLEKVYNKLCMEN